MALSQRQLGLSRMIFTSQLSTIMVIYRDNYTLTAYREPSRDKLFH